MFENENRFLSKLNNQYNIVFINIDEFNLNNDINGIEIARHIKELNDTTQIVFFSRNKKYVYDGYDIGISNYFLKPMGSKLNISDKKN